jgi:hypothetical protein
MSLLTISFQIIFLIINLICSGISPRVNSGVVADTHAALHASSLEATLHIVHAAFSASLSLLDDSSDTIACAAPSDTNVAQSPSNHVMCCNAFKFFWILVSISLERCSLYLVCLEIVAQRRIWRARTAYLISFIISREEEFIWSVEVDIIRLKRFNFTMGGKGGTIL